MKKKIFAVLLSLIMIIGLIPMSMVSAQDTDAVVSIEADKTSVKAGDTVTFSVYVESDVPFTTIEFIVEPPTGLTYVANSGKVADGLKQKLGFETVEFSEINRTAIIANDLPYNGTDKLKVVEFKCTVDSSALGDYSVGVADLLITDGNFEDCVSTITTADINVVIPVTGISLDKETLAVKQFEDVVTLIATVTPANATNKTLVWESSDTSIVEVTQDGVVTGMKKGTATVTVKTVEGNFADTCVVNVECTHNAGNDVPAEESTCIKQGHEAYSYCLDCGAITSGSDALLPLGEHKGGTATCQALAICSVCNQSYGSYAKHVLTKHDRVEADHSKAGNIEYYTCDVCNKFFGDENGTSEIQESETVLNQISHSHATIWSDNATHHWKECSCGDKAQYGTHVYDNTCDTTCNTCGAVRLIEHNYSTVWSTDANGHWHECTVCHDRADEGAHTGGAAKCNAKAVCTECSNEYGSLGGHNYVQKAETQYLKSAATCINEAVYNESCEYCLQAGTNTFEHGSVDADNHVGETEVRDEVKMTCEKDGYTGDTYCKSCNTKVQTGTVVPKKHNLKRVDAKAATHETDGNIEYYECKACDKLLKDSAATEEITFADTVIKKGEHAYSETLKNDKDNHWKECSCGDKIEVTAHEFGEFKVVKEATATEKGSKVRTCSVCGYEYAEEISATGTGIAGGTAESPKTGDYGKTFIWIALAFISMGAVSVVTIKKRKL